MEGDNIRAFPGPEDIHDAKIISQQKRRFEKGKLGETESIAEPLPVVEVSATALPFARLWIIAGIGIAGAIAIAYYMGKHQAGKRRKISARRRLKPFAATRRRRMIEENDRPFEND